MSRPDRQRDWYVPNLHHHYRVSNAHPLLGIVLRGMGIYNFLPTTYCRAIPLATSALVKYTVPAWSISRSDSHLPLSKGFVELSEVLSTNTPSELFKTATAHILWASIQAAQSVYAGHRLGLALWNMGVEDEEGSRNRALVRNSFIAA